MARHRVDRENSTRQHFGSYQRERELTARILAGMVEAVDRIRAERVQAVMQDAQARFTARGLCRGLGAE